MGKHITIYGCDVDIDMDDIDDDDLIAEIERRNGRNRKLKKPLLSIETDEILNDMPIDNLDFRLKFEAFMAGWESKPFTEINDFFTK